MSTTFIPGTNYRKHPLILPPEQNPGNVRPSAEKLRNLRIISEKSFTFNRPGIGGKRKTPLFSKFPEAMRSEMLARFELRLDHWQRVTGRRPIPGDHLYAKVVQGIERGFKTFWMDPKLAVACGKWSVRVSLHKIRVRSGTQVVGGGFHKREARAQGAKSASVLGVV
jgi:hypothetical protein